MKIALAQLRLLLSVILLIVGGAIAGLAGQASEAGGTAEVATLSTSTPNKVSGHIALMDPDNHRASCDSCPDCIHSGGPGCCAVGISTDECGVLHDAPDAVSFVVGKAFLATGIDPKALLQPPKIFA